MNLNRFERIIENIIMMTILTLMVLGSVSIINEILSLMGI